MKRTGIERKGIAGGAPKTELPVTLSMVSFRQLGFRVEP